MDLICLGVSHKTAPLSVRERLALSDQQQLELLTRVAGPESEALIISTCNRVEFYLAGPAGGVSRDLVLAEIAARGGDETLSHLYEHRGEAALVHLFRVSSSLDSMVMGEAQILGQVKEAFEIAQRSGAIRGELIRICEAAFAAAKRVRTETGIGRAAVSMASAAVELAIKVFGDLEGKAVLMVGAGEMAELSLRHLRAAGATDMVVTNRTFERADTLAKSVSATARPFEELSSLLVTADVVLCSVASPTPLLTQESLSMVLKARRHRPLFMVDLAVPRDIAPDVNELEGVYAYDMDDIQRVVTDNSAVRSAEAAKAEVMIAEEIARFSRDRALRDGIPVIARLRARAEQIAKAELERTFASLGDNLTEKQRQSIEAMAKAIINKLLHQPTAKLRETAPEQLDHRLAGAAAELFGLESEDPKR